METKQVHSTYCLPTISSSTKQVQMAVVCLSISAYQLAALLEYSFTMRKLQLNLSHVYFLHSDSMNFHEICATPLIFPTLY